MGPLEIVTAVVYTQEAMSQKNLQDEWVLRAAVRNGALAELEPESRQKEPKPRKKSA